MRVRPHNERWIFEAPDLVLGEFRCLPGDPAWDRTNRTGDWGPLIAFPRSAVGIAQEGRGEVVSDPSLVVLYPAGQPYRRALLSADGDRCSFIGMSRRLAAELAAGLDPNADDPIVYRFPFAAAPIDTHAYLLHHETRRRVMLGARDPDEIRESLYGVLGPVVTAGYRARHATPRRERPATLRAHAEVVDATRALLSAYPGARIPLDDLARAVHQSPFHLSRLFRARTGRTIHAYRTEIRLRTSLERLADGDSVADIALDLGFASQAHLTDRFRRSFGITPHLWRASLHRRQRLEIRKNVKASA